MNLHLNEKEFNEYIMFTSEYFHISKYNIKRDYYIVLMLQNLSQSEYKEKCVFKGGTSLSKCYSDTIKRFSEDIDLTFVGPDGFTNKQYDKALKKVEAIMSEGFELETIPDERNDRNKSANVWKANEDKKLTSVKLEIGSSIRPDPVNKKKIKTYIQQYMESIGEFEECKKYELVEVELNVLDVTRTFLDKVMSVKRHAICGTLKGKTRHIYDIMKLYSKEEIQTFLHNSEELKRLLKITKETDSFYLQKRGISKEYNPLGRYDFNSWKYTFNDEIKNIFYNLKNDLLYDSNEQLDFNKAIETFEALDKIFEDIGE